MHTRLKQIRTELNLTQPEMGAVTGKSRDTIANYELGRVKPDDTFLMLLYEKYGYNVDWIKTGTGDRKVKTPYWEAGISFVSKAMQQSVPDARDYLNNFFRDWPDEDVLIACALMKKHFSAEHPKEPAEKED